MRPPKGGPLKQRLIIVSGKGGVGKSSVAAALALSFARNGERTLLCEINAQARAASLLGHPEVGAQLEEVEKNLWCVDVHPPDALKEYVLMTIKFERVYRAVFENRLVKYFLRFLPSLQELVMLGKLLFHVREKLPNGQPRFDRVVMDAPATGHAVAFLSVPQVLLDTVPAGPLATDVTWMRDMLVDPEVTAGVLVSLPEEMPVNETLELAQAFADKLHIQVTDVVLNCAVSARFSAGELAALTAHPALEVLARGYEQRVRMSEDAKTQLGAVGVPLVEVPRLFTPEFTRESLLQMAEALRPLWEGG